MTPATATRVLLVDDHPAILTGLACILEAEADLVVVGAVQSAPEAPEAFLRTRPDVVVLDLSMPELDGSDVLVLIQQHDPGVGVLVLTSTSDPETVGRVLDAGASGYMRKDCGASELVAAVRSVARGEVPLDPRVTRALLQRPAPADSSEELTGREQDVLRLVALGLANKQIALRLGIGESTVKTHLSNAFRRIGVTDRTSAALWVRGHQDHRLLGRRS